MRVTVLGKSPSWEDAGGACSGYLVQQDDFTLLLDCGSGVFSKLRPVRDYLSVDAVVITHMHADHFLDLVPFSYALRNGPRQQRAGGNAGGAGAEPIRPALYLPQGGREVLRRVVGAWGTEDLVEGAFDVHDYASCDRPDIGPLQLRFCEVPHYVTTCAVEFAAQGTRFTFGADCGPNEALVGFAQGTDLLMVEATLEQPEADGQRGHLTAGEAGAHGRAAAARRLVLTHYSDELDPEHTRSEAAAAYGGEVDLARDGAVYDI